MTDDKGESDAVGTDSNGSPVQRNSFMEHREPLVYMCTWFCVASFLGPLHMRNVHVTFDPQRNLRVNERLYVNLLLAGRGPGNEVGFVHPMTLK